MTKETALKLRKKIKDKKPNFLRSDGHKKAKLEKKWRKPKGLQNKLRRCLKGHGHVVSPGYGSPKEVKDLSKNGLKIVIVNNVNQLENAGKNCDIIIASNTGERKKVEILSQAKKLGLNILNIKDVDAYLKETEELMKSRKEKRSSKIKSKEQKTKKAEKAAEEKKKKEEEQKKEMTEEEKKKEEKEEKNKVLTAKE